MNLINSMTKVAARQRVIAAPAGSPEVALGTLCSTEERLRVNATLLNCGSCSSTAAGLWVLQGTSRSVTSEI